MAGRGGIGPAAAELLGGDEIADGARVGLRDLAGEVGLGAGHLGDPVDLGGTGGALIGVGERQHRAL